MKKYFTLLIILTCSFSFSQTVFWQETFGTGCSQGTVANVVATPSNGAWFIVSMLGGIGNGASANDWFISASSAGLPIGLCADGCVNTPSLTNKTLHISSPFPPKIDTAAIYKQSFTSNTNKRAESPTINCTAWGSMTVSFNFLASQNIPTDVCELMYTENGANWNSIDVLPATTTSCAGSATWATISYTLPASADGSPNLKIGFRWQNQAVAGPGKTSVAIDDIKLTGVPFTGTGIHGFANSDLQIKLFPNPVKDKLSLEFEQNTIESLSIVNCLGQIVFTSNEPKHEMDVSFLKNGVYFLNVQSKWAQKTFKLVIDN